MTHSMLLKSQRNQGDITYLRSLNKDTNGMTFGVVLCAVILPAIKLIISEH